MPEIQDKKEEKKDRANETLYCCLSAKRKSMMINAIDSLTPSLLAGCSINRRSGACTDLNISRTLKTNIQNTARCMETIGEPSNVYKLNCCLERSNKSVLLNSIDHKMAQLRTLCNNNPSNTTCSDIRLYDKLKPVIQNTPECSFRGLIP